MTPVKEIELTQGLKAIVDDADFEWASAIRWFPLYNGTTTYAISGYPVMRGGCVSRRLHRLILEAPAGVHVDHENGDGLDNRRSNLRLATRSQNAHNMHRLPRNTSGFKGVSYQKTNRKWRAQIQCGERTYHLGYHATPEEAARAYDAKARELFGEYARTNFN
jgi:hypothetical protein